MTHFLLRDLTWSVLRAWTQNHPQVVGTCPGDHPQPIAQNRVFKSERPEKLSVTILVNFSLISYIRIFCVLNDPSQLHFLLNNLKFYEIANLKFAQLKVSTHVWSRDVNLNVVQSFYKFISSRDHNFQWYNHQNMIYTIQQLKVANNAFLKILSVLAILMTSLWRHNGLAKLIHQPKILVHFRTAVENFRLYLRPKAFLLSVNLFFAQLNTSLLL